MPPKKDERCPKCGQALYSHPTCLGNCTVCGKPDKTHLLCQACGIRIGPRHEVTEAVLGFYIPVDVLARKKLPRTTGQLCPSCKANYKQEPPIYV